jgi:hypothetical protein
MERLLIGKTLVFILFAFQSLQAQNLYFGFQLGSYNMKDMKSIQADVLAQYISVTNVSVAKELEFPASLQAEGGIDFKLDEKNTLGGFFNYAITKGRIGYSDYSGSLSFGQDLSRYLFGIKYQLFLKKYLALQSKLGFNHSNLNITSGTFVTGTTGTTTAENFYSNGVSVIPGVSLYHHFSRVSFQLELGYEMNFQSKTYYGKDSRAYLLVNTQSNEKAYIDWSGFRSGLLIGILLNKQEHRE